MTKHDTHDVTALDVDLAQLASALLGPHDHTITTAVAALAGGSVGLPTALIEGYDLPAAGGRGADPSAAPARGVAPTTPPSSGGTR